MQEQRPSTMTAGFSIYLVSNSRKIQYSFCGLYIVYVVTCDM